MKIGHELRVIWRKGKRALWSSIWSRPFFEVVVRAFGSIREG